jgi:hypothetical protein
MPMAVSFVAQTKTGFTAYFLRNLIELLVRERELDDASVEKQRGAKRKRTPVDWDMVAMYSVLV